MAENTTLRLAGVIKESIVDGPGLRFYRLCPGLSPSLSCPQPPNP